jgi:hypothetical protein
VRGSAHRSAVSLLHLAEQAPTEVVGALSHLVPRGSDRPCQFAVVRVYGSHTSGTSMLPRSAVSRGTSANVARRTEPTSRCSSPARPTRQRETRRAAYSQPLTEHQRRPVGGWRLLLGESGSRARAAAAATERESGRGARDPLVFDGPAIHASGWKPENVRRRAPARGGGRIRKAPPAG